jgi:hypothetical protein
LFNGISSVSRTRLVELVDAPTPDPDLRQGLKP